uniref:Velvet domain-containing protein n=1 Tax=Kwoniella dejecticola CBS 10117 TaxID=1296121 RepID=A0A1A5ZXJ7_9TREE|nr:uncharacterized protein I303_07291 [Kwoniella dejecticola CBS 10117]OBR82531.1 hypothetical protein I303_07291 [Kwoniella dejecticola CBS 10117]
MPCAVDRRPVDPPPVVELRSDEIPLEQLLESTSFFIRATIVSASAVKVPFPDHGLPSILEPYYPAVKTPTGADATTGEVVQTPEKLRLLDGKPGALCIFAKLSVRVPGVFRLMFTLYDTTDAGLVELTRTVSEPFEVFSPKLFKGMHESTPLTRHLAAQGVKVKLRTDTSVGRQSTSRKRTPATSANSGSIPIDRPSTISSSASPLTQNISSTSSPTTHHSPLDRSRNTSTQPPPRKTALTSTRSLVWGPSMENMTYGQHLLDDYPQTAIPGPGPSTLKRRRFQDDGLIPSLKEITSKYDFTPTPPATDLAAFSLSRGTSTANSPKYHSPPRQASPSSDFRISPSLYPSQYPHSHPLSHPSSQWSSDQVNTVSSASSSTSNIASPISLNSNSRSTPSSVSSTIPSPFPRMQLGPGDDGIPILPLPSIFASSGSSTSIPHSHISQRPSAPFIPPSVNQVLDREQHYSPTVNSTPTSISTSPVVPNSAGSGYMAYSGRSSISPRTITTSGSLGRGSTALPPDLSVAGQGQGQGYGPGYDIGSPPTDLPPLRSVDRAERYADGR